MMKQSRADREATKRRQAKGEDLARQMPLEVWARWDRAGHSRLTATEIAADYGWRPGRTYTALTGGQSPQGHGGTDNDAKTQKDSGYYVDGNLDGESVW